MIKSLREIADKKIGFSPVYVNANLLTSEKISSLYRFIITVFPGVVQTVSTYAISDLTKGVKRWSDSITEDGKKELIKALKGTSIDINVSINQDGAGHILSLPFNVRMDYFLEKFVEAKAGTTKLDTEIKEIKEVLLPIIRAAIKQRIKELLEGFLTLEALRPAVRVEIKKLIEEGLITKEGRIAEGVDIDELLSGEHAIVFNKVDAEELLRCGLIKG